jgi:hypothetical protein
MMSALVKGASASGGGVKRWTIDPLCRTKVDGRFVKVPQENMRWNRGSIGRDFHEFVGSLIVSSCDMVEL